MDNDDLYYNIINFSNKHAASCDGCSLSHTVFSAFVEPMALLKVKFPDAYKSIILAMEKKYD